MKDITLVPVDTDGDMLTETFTKAPVDVSKDEWIDTGIFLKNENEIDFGKASKGVVVMGVIFTTDVGFFSSSNIITFGTGPVTIKAGWELAMPEKHLEIQQSALDF